MRTRIQVLIAAVAAVVLASDSHAELCRVSALEGRNVWSSGHGVYVGDGLVLTAKHVLRGTRGSARVTFVKSGRVVAGTPVAMSDSYDLAGICVQAPPDAKPWPVRADWPQGYARSVRSRGVVQRGRMNEYGREILTWGGPSVSGDSGGPVWDDEGKLVSIVCTTDNRVSHGPPPNKIANFIAQFRQRHAPT